MIERNSNKVLVSDLDVEDRIKGGDNNISFDKSETLNNAEDTIESREESMNSYKESLNSRKERRRQRREKRIQGLKESRSFWLISTITKWADKYFLDALLGFIPSVGDLVSSAFGLPFIYVSLVKLKSIPLTLAIIYNYLVDILLGSIPFFIGDAIDFFSKAHVKNLNLITRYVEGDRNTIRQVRSKALVTAILIILLSVIIYFVFRLLIGVTEWTWSLIVAMFNWLIALLNGLYS